MSRQGQFTPGNKLWNQRDRAGRELTFSTPELLWDAALGYFEYVDNNPDIREKAFGTGLLAEEKIKVPYTMLGFCIYCGVNGSYMRQFKADCAKNERPYDNAFTTIIEDIENIIYTQKFNGASNGFFNANLIARDLGLVDKKEVDNKGVITVNVDSDDAELGKA